MASHGEGQGHRPPCPAWRNPVLVQAGVRRGEGQEPRGKRSFGCSRSPAWINRGALNYFLTGMILQVGLVLRRDFTQMFFWIWRTSGIGTAVMLESEYIINNPLPQTMGAANQ